MDDREVRLRTFYVFVKSAELFESIEESLSGLLEAGDRANPHQIRHLLRRETGILFRYWATRYLWDALDQDEEIAKRMNLSLLRIFAENFEFPRDGSGLKYAELSTPYDEAREWIRRLNKQIPIDDLEGLRQWVQKDFLQWRQRILDFTQESLVADLEWLQAAADQWVQRDAD